LLTTVGEITINNTRVFSRGNHGFQLSALLQELMVYAGTLDCYGRCEEIIEKFISVPVSETQVYRLTDLYGKQVGETVDVTRRTEPPLPPADILYVEADASLLLTREQGWKEVKVGRLFKASDCLHAEGKPGLITHSQYMARMGGCKGFTQNMEALIEDYTFRQEQLVFLSDGAPWLRTWIEDAFPRAVSILDFYHLMEHVCAFAEAFFADKQTATQWAEAQKELFLQSQPQEVVINIEALPASKQSQRLKAKLLAYLAANFERMGYKRYQTIGCGIIGSGAVESAHRTVVQKRMKLSGQRWSCQGAKNMLNLRVVYMNNQWAKVIELAKSPLQNSA
jgi:hypothetical protein